MSKKSFSHLLAITVTMLFSNFSLVGCSSCSHVITDSYVVYSPGENLTALTKIHETEYVCDYPYGGDKGQNLFFAVHDKAGNSNIYRKDNPTSMSMGQLTGGKNRNISPSYCAATNMVAFDGRPEGNLVSDIYMVNATQGGALQQITNTPDAHEQYPCLSRDGKKIVYEKVRKYGNEKDTEIWIKNLQTNENIQLGLGRTPSFSPDGKYIVFVKYASDGYTTCLCIINADGGNLTQLTDVSMGTVWRPCFSPDGKRVVFQCKKVEKGDYDLYIIECNGNGLTQLTMNTSYDGEPYWADDGNIYFTSDRGGHSKHYQIWRFRYQTLPLPEGKIHTVSNSETITETQFPPSPERKIHTVSSGETITDIARRYGITVRDVVKWNKLSTMTITPGMKLKVSAQ